MPLFSWLDNRTRQRRAAVLRRQLARDLYDRIVAQARHPAFYRQFGVADTVRGRFELLTLHMYLVLGRLRPEAEGGGHELAQVLVDVMFDDMDDVARELGIGDMGVAPRIKKLARSFRSRLEAYENAVKADGPQELVGLVRETLYVGGEGTNTEAAAIAAYLRRERTRLASSPLDELTRASADLFGAPIEEEKHERE